jgi:hypothetical protein
MEDTRRLLRYVIPGYVYVLATTLYVWILFPPWVERQVPGLLSTGAVITTVVASGAIGYIFSVVHHCLHNLTQWRVPIDYSKVLNQLVASGNLHIVSASDGNPVQHHFLRKDALPVMTSLWHERTESSALVRAAQPKLDALHDAAHASGTARVAVFFALVTTGIIASQVSEWAPQRLCAWLRIFWLAVAVVPPFLVLWINYYHVGNIAQKVIDEVFADAIAQENREGRRPVATVVVRETLEGAA